MKADNNKQMIALTAITLKYCEKNIHQDDIIVGNGSGQAVI
jgi:hypothetical protein